MKQQAPEILTEKDILGLEKPKNQLNHLKKSDGWVLFMALMILAFIAVAVYYF